MATSVETNPSLRRFISRYAALESLAAGIAMLGSLVFPAGPILIGVYFLAGWLPAALTALAWCLSGIFVLIPVLSADLISWLCGFREPTSRELQRLEAAWDDVCRSSGIAADVFVLRVYPCPPPHPDRPPYINAFTAGMNVVATTADALAVLDSRALRSMLAHELGHHAGFDPVPRALVAWYLGLTEAILRRLGLTPAALWLRFVYVPITLLIGLSSRPCEYAADAFAKRLGYGEYLARLLLSLPSSRHMSFTSSLLATHPSSTDRARRLTSHS